MATKVGSTRSKNSQIATARLVVLAIFVAMLGAAAESAGGSIATFGLALWVVALVIAGIGAWRIALSRRPA
jgi:hypothetical protein